MKFLLAYCDRISSYIVIAANSGVSRQYIEAHLFTTAGQWGISGRNLKFTPIPFPSAAEQALVVREVERRLAAADRLTETLSRQLERAHAARQFLLNQAFSGDLVPQDPDDESASFLLERILAARHAPAKKPRGQLMSRSRTATKTAERRSLLTVLQENGGPMTPEELFHASGHSQESVDQFFAELRELTDIPARIVEERKSKAIALLKVAQ